MWQLPHSSIESETKKSGRSPPWAAWHFVHSKPPWVACRPFSPDLDPPGSWHVVHRACGGLRSSARPSPVWGLWHAAQPPPATWGKAALRDASTTSPWQSAHRAFTGLRVAKGSVAPGPRWQVLQSPDSNGAWSDSRKRALRAEACGSWHWWQAAFSTG